MSNLVSIIITTYNRGELILATLNSVLKQTYKNIEVIIVDDGSTDNTAKIIASIEDKRIKYVYQNNEGVNKAKNWGLSLAEGEYTTIVDSDDIILPEKIEKQVKILDKNPQFDVCFTGSIATDENLNPIKKLKINKADGHYLTDLLARNQLYNGSDALYRTQCLKHHDIFDETINSMVDWNLYLKLSIFSNYITIPEYLLLYRQHNENMSKNLDKYKKSGFKILGKVFNTPYFRYANTKIKKRAYSYRHLYLSERYIETDNKIKSLKHLIKSLKLSPYFIFKIRTIKVLIKNLLYIKGNNYATNKYLHT